MLKPDNGNIHEFRAGPTGATILDIITPQYESGERECTYYKLVQETETEKTYLISSDTIHDELEDSFDLKDLYL